MELERGYGSAAWRDGVSVMSHGSFDQTDTLRLSRHACAHFPQPPGVIRGTSNSEDACCARTREHEVNKACMNQAYSKV